MSLTEKIQEAKTNHSEELDLSFGELTGLPKELFELNWLQELNLSSNQFTALPPELFQLPNLVKLNLRGNRLTKLPKEIGRLIHLKELHLGSNHLAVLPEEILELTDLTRLNLRGNQLTKIPDQIERLSNLKELLLSDNDFTELPLKIFMLPNLTKLVLRGNKLSQLPEGIIPGPKMRELDLGNNKFTELPKVILELTSLRELDLRGNRLISLPEEIKRLSKLVKLDLGDNELSEVPEGLMHLLNLKELCLRMNRLTGLPPEIEQLMSLIRLDLAANRLAALPKEISNLGSLIELDLSENQITKLPQEIVTISGLAELYLGDNPLVTPPIEIACQGIEEIRNYFQASLESGAQKLYSAKLIIVGQGGVGKTSLAKKLLRHDLELNEHEQSTEGIDIENWSWDWEKNGEKVEFKVNIWDFGGQEIYHATHQFFITKRSVYLFVWDARQEEHSANFGYWLNVISLLSDKSPVIIVSNKIDERIKEIDQASLKEKFPNIVGFRKVSCRDGRGICDLEQLIKETFVNLPHVGSDWPNVWTAISKELKAGSRDYMDYIEYRAICDRYGLDEERAGYLSSYLHDLGIILHFQGDKILKNIVILDPEWGTRAVYQVLDTQTVIAHQGRFSFGDLKYIWKDSHYPTEKHIELLQLMMKFELCFNLMDTDEYIVPELLPLDRPEYQWNDNNNLRFEYQYEFMPSGIITRFIVRNYHLIANNTFWKNGVILERNHSRALVIAEPLNRKIKIAISVANAQGLLAIIRASFDQIHKTLNQPRLREMIPCICGECRGQGSEYYDLNDLNRYRAKRKTTIECRKSLEEVQLADLAWIMGPEEEVTTEGVATSGAATSADANSGGVNNVFISYSHHDSRWLELLQKHLKPYERNCSVVPWADTMLKPGERWFDSIQTALHAAKVAVLLVSPDFLASEFIAKHELPPLLEAAKENGVTIFWIAVSASSYRITEIAGYQCANDPKQPLDSLSEAERNSKLVSICNRIMEALGA